MWWQGVACAARRGAGEAFAPGRFGCERESRDAAHVQIPSPHPHPTSPPPPPPTLTPAPHPDGAPTPTHPHPHASPWRALPTQDELVQLLRSDGRRQAAQRMMRQKRDGQGQGQQQPGAAPQRRQGSPGASE